MSKKSLSNIPGNVFRFYADGFRSMTIGKKLWAIIIIKLIVIFAVLKLFFFPDILRSRYDNDADRAQAVRRALTECQWGQITNDEFRHNDTTHSHLRTLNLK